jgi:hypothetical protein
MNNIKAIFAGFFLVVTISSCSKDDLAPVIVVSSPLEGAILEKGKTYPIVGIVTDDTELASIDAAGIKITTFDSKTSHSLSGLNLPIDAAAPAGGGNFTITATDKEGNVAKKVVNFTIK